MKMKKSLFDFAGEKFDENEAEKKEEELKKRLIKKLRQMQKTYIKSIKIIQKTNL